MLLGTPILPSPKGIDVKTITLQMAADPKFLLRGCKAAPRNGLAS